MSTAVLATVPETATATADPTVIDSSQRAGPQRTVQVLGDAGVFVDDEARGAVLMAKRVNHALFSDFSREGLSPELLDRAREMQSKYRAMVQEKPYGELVDSGALNELLDTYMNFLLDRSREKLARLKEGKLKTADEMNPASLLQMIQREEKRMHDLTGELKTYGRDAKYTQAMLRRVETLVKQQRYLPLGKLVVQSGLVKNADAVKAADMVSDVLGATAARNVGALAGLFESVNAVAAQEGPDAEVHSQAIALAVRQATQPLSALFDIEMEGTQLDMIVALRTLLSAQLHQAFSENLTQPQRIALEKAAQSVTAEYAQVAMSLAYHYMGEGASASDSRVQTIRANFKREMDSRGIVLIDSVAEAQDRARKLARTSAQDLMVAVKDEPALAMIRTLAKAAGDPVDTLPLQPKSQLVGLEINDPADYHHLFVANNMVGPINPMAQNLIGSIHPIDMYKEYWTAREEDALRMSAPHAVRKL